MAETHAHIDPESPMTMGMAQILLRKMEAIEQRLDKIAADHPEYVSVPTFCKLTGAKRSTVIHYLNAGRLQGRKIGTKGHTSPWEIPYREVERYLTKGI